MTKPRILRITRPYESVADFIQSEGWSISSKRMILLEQPRLDRDTIVRFELSLQSGEKLIRAEARVVGYQTATPDKPGGPKVRFKRFGGTTKAFIQQVVAEHGPGPGLDTLHPSGRDSGAPSEAPMSLRFSDPDVSGTATIDRPTAEQPLKLKVPLSRANEEARHSAGAEDAPPLELTLSPGDRQRLHQLMLRERPKQVPTPQDRESLLKRLRERARMLSDAQATRGDTGPSSASLVEGASQTG